MTDTLYSLTLLAALVSGAVGAFAGILSLCRPWPRVRWIGLRCGLLALALGVLSIGVHLHFGHGPAAPEPMALGRFLRIHPAYGAVFVLVLFAIGSWCGSRRDV